MAKIFSVASWNVEHFKDTTDVNRVKRVADFINGSNGGPAKVPDVFALFEVEGKYLYKEFMDKFPNHHFHMTEGKQTQEIFVGISNKLQSFVTQRLEFKEQRDFLRPGLLLTIRKNNTDYTLLFLHTKSGANTEDFGLRDASLLHAFNLKKVLDNKSGGNANFLFMGDLNTMGIDDPVPYSKKMNLTSVEEIARIKHWAGKRNMRLVLKDKTTVEGVDKEVTWWNGSSGYKPTNLDHLLASDHLIIKGQGQADISLLGWPKLPANKWKKWYKDYSDHAMLYFEVH